jgi:holo-[acyl-carrier protein] synthase
MRILGHGIDLVEVARLRRAIDEHGVRFVDRVFTPSEQSYASANPRRYFEHLAGRFAAKEAVLKALGTGWRGGIAWTDIEVELAASGMPCVKLSGETAEVARRAGIHAWHLSITHIETHAMASAIGTG